jgi:hypothetical protein
LPRRPTEVAIIRLFLECISSSAIAWTAIERVREILGVNASTAPDDNTPRVIMAHAVMRLLGYPWRCVRPKSVPTVAKPMAYENYKQFQLCMSSWFYSEWRAVSVQIELAKTRSGPSPLRA